MHPHFNKPHYHIRVKFPNGKTMQMSNIFIESNRVGDIVNKCATDLNDSPGNFNLYYQDKLLNKNTKLSNTNIGLYDRSSEPLILVPK